MAQTELQLKPRLTFLPNEAGINWIYVYRDCEIYLAFI